MSLQSLLAYEVPFIAVLIGASAVTVLGTLIFRRPIGGSEATTSLPAFTKRAFMTRSLAALSILAAFALSTLSNAGALAMLALIYSVLLAAWTDTPLSRRRQLEAAIKDCLDADDDADMLERLHGFELYVLERLRESSAVTSVRVLAGLDQVVRSWMEGKGTTKVRAAAIASCIRIYGEIQPHLRDGFMRLHAIRMAVGWCSLAIERRRQVKGAPVADAVALDYMLRDDLRSLASGPYVLAFESGYESVLDLVLSYVESGFLDSASSLLEELEDIQKNTLDCRLRDRFRLFQARASGLRHQIGSLRAAKDTRRQIEVENLSGRAMAKLTHDNSYRVDLDTEIPVELRQEVSQSVETAMRGDRIVPFRRPAEAV